MPKQGRRLKVWICPECGRVENELFGLHLLYEPPYCNQHVRVTEAPEKPNGFPIMQEVEVMPTQEHIAALEGLAATLDAQAKGKDQAAIRKEEVGKYEAARHREGEAFAYRAIAKEVRNLIEQGGADG